MEKIILSIYTMLLLSVSYASDYKSVKPKGWYVESLFSIKEWLGVSLNNNSVRRKKFFKVNVKTFDVMEISEEQSKKDFQLLSDVSSDKIDYTLNNCKSVDEEYLSYDSSCESATVTVNGNKYSFTGDKYYKWETFVEPLLWDNNLVFKAYLPKSKSGDTGRWSGPSVNGIMIADLNSLKRRDKLGGAFVTVLTLDKLNSYLWVGSQYGIYAYDKNFKEVISCAFPNDLKRINVKEFSFVCGNADYVLSNKFDQSRLLIEKHSAVKQGKKPPEDSAKRVDEAVKKLLNKK